MRIDTTAHTPCYMGPPFSVREAEKNADTGVQYYRPEVILNGEPHISDKRFPSYGEAFEAAYKLSHGYGAH